MITDLCDERTPAAASALSRPGKVKPPNPRAPILRKLRRGERGGAGGGARGGGLRGGPAVAPFQANAHLERILVEPIDGLERLVLVAGLDVHFLGIGSRIEREGPLLGLALLRERQVLAVLVELQRGPLRVHVLALRR